MTRPAPSSRVSAAATPMRPSTGWRRCSKRARTSASSAAGWSFSRARTWVTPTRTPCRWPSLPCRPASSSASPKLNSHWRSASPIWPALPSRTLRTIAIGEARADVQENRLIPVPIHLRDSHYGGAKRLGHGKDYDYAHNAEGGVAAQDYLGVERTYYRPVPRGFEVELAQRLEAIRAKLKEGKSSQ